MRTLELRVQNGRDIHTHQTMQTLVTAADIEDRGRELLCIVNLGGEAGMPRAVCVNAKSFVWTAFAQDPTACAPLESRDPDVWRPRVGSTCLISSSPSSTGGIAHGHDIGIP